MGCLIAAKRSPPGNPVLIEVTRQWNNLMRVNGGVMVMQDNGNNEQTLNKFQLIGHKLASV